MQEYPKELVSCEVEEKDIIYIKGNSYSNKNLLVVVPTRGMIHVKVVISWKTLLYPMNSNISHMFIEGDEIGVARDKAVDILNLMETTDTLLFLDDDILLPSHAIVKLFRELETENYDIISGLYHMKNDIRTPIAYRMVNGLMESISLEELNSNKVIDVDVVPMGCTLIRKSIFQKLTAPYFNTVNVNLGINKKNDTLTMTEDVYFCKKAKEIGAKIGVHTAIRCGHIDVKSGVIY